MIGSLAGLSFNAFLLNVAPAAVLVLGAQVLMIHLLWGRATEATIENRLRVMTMNAPAAIVDLPLLVQSLAVLALVIMGLVVADRLHLQAATIASASATLVDIGFSQSTCLPALAARIVYSACIELGRAT